MGAEAEEPSAQESTSVENARCESHCMDYMRKNKYQGCFDTSYEQTWCNRLCGMNRTMCSANCTGNIRGNSGSRGDPNGQYASWWANQLYNDVCPNICYNVSAEDKEVEEVQADDKSLAEAEEPSAQESTSVENARCESHCMDYMRKNKYQGCFDTSYEQTWCNRLCGMNRTMCSANCTGNIRGNSGSRCDPNGQYASWWANQLYNDVCPNICYNVSAEDKEVEEVQAH